MRSTLLAAIPAGLLAIPAHSAVLTASVFDNGALVDTVTSNNGALSLASSDAAFSDITLSATGAPLIPNADLSSVTLDVKDDAPGTHVLTVDVFQTGVSGAGRAHSAFTVNNLFGAGVIGPTTESTFINGTNSTLGSVLASHSFGIGTVQGAFGPVDSALPTSGVFADAHQYSITFHGAGSANDSIQLTTNIPEPSTWTMMLLGGFGFMGLIGWRKKTSRSLTA